MRSGAPLENRNRQEHGLRSRKIRAIARYLRITSGGALGQVPEDAI